MCGIIGYLGAAAPLSIITDGLRRLEYRGYDSSGLAYLDTAGLMQVRKAAGKLEQLLAQLGNDEPTITAAIGHTRWATHGIANDSNAHPHMGPNRRVALVHNGIIENYHDLRAQLTANGATFLSDTDTESVVQLLELNARPDIDFMTTIRQTLQSVTGAYALTILSADQPGQLFATRRQVPLAIGIGKGVNDQPRYMVVSDPLALAGQADQIVHLLDGDIARMTSDGLTIIDADGRSVSRQAQPFTLATEIADKQSYAHYMLKEIHEQPDVVRHTLAAWRDDANLRLLLKAAPRIIITGCGTSLNAALAGKYFIESLTGTPVDVDAAGEFRYRCPALRPTDLIIASSQSGETADTLAALRLAQASGVTTIALTNRIDSSIAREADLTIPLPAGPEISVAATKSFVAQVVTLYLLGVEMLDDQARQQQLRAELSMLPVKLTQLLENVDIASIAIKYAEAKAMLFIGRCEQYPIALEAALKLKEISYIHAAGYSASELKHGPLALLDASLPVVAIVMQGTMFEKMISNCQEAKARGAPLIALTDAPLPASLQNLFDDVMIIPSAPEHFAPILTTVTLQLWAYYIALALGRDVDQPRNLAKSVTVE